MVGHHGNTEGHSGTPHSGRGELIITLAKPLDSDEAFQTKCERFHVIEWLEKCSRKKHDGRCVPATWQLNLELKLNASLTSFLSALEDFPSFRQVSLCTREGWEAWRATGTFWPCYRVHALSPLSAQGREQTEERAGTFHLKMLRRSWREGRWVRI